jgi:hypothetical protein
LKLPSFLNDVVVHRRKMPKFKKPRVNKTKKEIVSNIQLVQDAERRRALVKDVLFPYLMEMKETIGYSKIFLQSFNSIVNGVFDEQRKTTTIGSITYLLTEKIVGLFDLKDERQKVEYDRYMGLVEKLKDISVQDLMYGTELPRYIDGYNIQQQDKLSIDIIPIESILGK